MATPFQYTPQQAETIRHALIQGHLYTHLHNGAGWRTLLRRIRVDVTMDMDERGDWDTRVLYAHEVRRRYTALLTALDAAIHAHQGLGPPLQMRLAEILDLPHAVPWGDAPPRELIALRRAVKQAATPPYKLCAPVQTTGAPTNWGMRCAVSNLLNTFKDVTGLKRATVYWSEHQGYTGTAFPFLVAALAPVRLVPRTKLNAAILLAYKDEQKKR